MIDTHPLCALPNLPDYDDIYREFCWQIPEKFNIGVAVCDYWAELEPSKIALIDAGKQLNAARITYGQLRDKSNRLANVLTSKGLKSGDRVAIILPQSWQALVSHLAIYKCGAIAVPLARLFAADALKYRLENSETSIVITNDNGLKKLDEILPNLPNIQALISVDATVSNERHYNFDRLISTANPLFSAIETNADTPALIIYTSGTTGPPKGALHAHRVLLGHIPGVQVHHEYFPTPGDIAWTPADWAWAGGLLNILLPCLYLGVPVVFGGLERFTPDDAYKLMQDYKVTRTFIPPTALRLMKSSNTPASNYKLKLRTIGTGGESLGKDTWDWAQRELGISINEFYGQTECNLVLSGFGARGISKPGTIGKPVPGHQVAIIDGEGNPCKPNQRGEVAIKRPDPVMFLGYWKNEKATNDKFLGDWMLTGDQCEMDGDGYYNFVGRDDDIISSAGFRIGPGEIEDCLISHPAVKLAAAVGKPDQLRGEVIKAYIVLTENFDTDVDEVSLMKSIQTHVKSRMAANVFPREIEIVEEIPLTTSGKVIRRIFREKAVGETKQ